MCFQALEHFEMSQEMSSRMRVNQRVRVKYGAFRRIYIRDAQE